MINEAAATNTEEEKPILHTSHPRWSTPGKTEVIKKRPTTSTDTEKLPNGQKGTPAEPKHNLPTQRMVD